MSAPEAKRDPVEELAEDFARRLRRGERPSLSEYTSRHPELAAEIHDLFPALVVMEQFGSIAEPHPTLCTRLLSSGKVLGDFRIIREIARGGMGIVYEAVQESLGRHVALKVLPAGGPGAVGASRERFRREARAAARLHHTSIVPVFAIGEDRDTLYYAMQFIRGQGLDSVLAEVRRLRKENDPNSAANQASGIALRLMTGQPSQSPGAPPTEPGPIDSPSDTLPSGRCESRPPSTSEELATQPEARYFREVARLGIQAAEALHYAHQQGVLHRDVKPSNLLLDSAGTLWVTDFGLAKAQDSDDLTATGDLIGTLRYMAPERFEGRADARADVYSLAVTLYELITLRPAFDDPDRLKLVEKIGRSVPQRMRSLAPEAPRDLETVIHKALARAAGDRYSTAQDLADDLRRFVDGRPVKARRHGWSEQAWRWCRRNPVVAGLATTVALLLCAVAAVSTAAAIQLNTALNDANNNLARAVTAEIDADTNRWRGLLLDARSSRLSRAPGQRIAALAALKQAVSIAQARGMPPERFTEMRTEAIAALALPDLYVEHWWSGWPAGTQQSSFTSDLQTYARVDAEGGVSVRQVADDVERFRIPSLSGANSACLSPNGRYVFQFQTAEPHRGRLWDLTSGRPAIRLEESALDINHVFQRDSRTITLTYLNGDIRVFESGTGRRLHQLPADELRRGIWIDHHPLAPYVAVSSYFHSAVLVRDLATGVVIARLNLPWSGGGYATWHPSGRELCVCHGDGAEIGVFNFDAKGDPAFTYRRSFSADVGGGGRIAFNPAGDRVAVSGWAGNTVLCDYETGRTLAQAPPSRAALQFDATGTRIAAAARPDEGKIGFWSIGDGRECRAIVYGRATRPRPPAVSPDGRIVVACLAEGFVLFELSTGRELATLPYRKNVELGNVGSYAFDSTGALLTNSMDGCFRWPIRSDREAPGKLTLGPPEQLPFYPGNQAISTSRDGRVIAQAMWNGYGMQEYSGGWILHPNRPGRPARVAAGEAAGAVAVSPDGRLVAFGLQGDGLVRVFDTDSLQQVWSVRDATRCQFTPDGRWLAADADGTRLYAAATGVPGLRLGTGLLQCLSNDGRMAVLGSHTDTFRLVSLESGRELARLEDPDQYAELATLTPDGTRVVALTRDGLRVWNLQAIRSELAALSLDWDAPVLPPAQPVTPIECITVIGAEQMSEPP